MIPPEAAATLDGDDRPIVHVRKATYVGMSNKFAQVDMGDSRFVCDFGSGYVPTVGETVRVWSVGDQHLLFPAGPRPTVGTVVTSSGLSVTVSTSTGSLTMPYVGAAPTSGDRVGLVWSEDGVWCAGKLSSTSAAPPPVPDPGGGGEVRSATFRAVDAGSTDRGSTRWWQTQPWASDSTYGAWFYGSQIKDTIPVGATLVSMEIYINRVQNSGSAPNFTLHSSPFKAGVPAMSGLLAWEPSNGWNYVPNTGWFAALIGGGAYYGVGLNQGGFNKFASLAQDSMSGAIRISWRS